MPLEATPLHDTAARVVCSRAVDGPVRVPTPRPTQNRCPSALYLLASPDIPALS